MKMAWKVLKDSINGFIKDDCFSSGAAIAFYAIFSLPSLFVVVWTVAAFFGFSAEDLAEIAESQAGVPLMSSFQGNGSSDSTEGQTQQPATATEQPAVFGGVLGRGVGLAILLFSATGILAQLQYSLNRAWEVAPDPQSGGVMSFLVKRIVSLGLVLVIAFLLLTSLILTTMIDQIIVYLQGATPSSVVQAVSRILNEAVTFILATALFGAMYKILPDAKMKWRDVLKGAVITSLLFLVGRLVLSWYLRTTDVASGWDQAARSVVVVLVWMYYTSLIVLYGAEVTQAWMNRNGVEIQPEEGAVRTIRKKERVRDGSSQIESS